MPLPAGINADGSDHLRVPVRCVLLKAAQLRRFQRNICLLSFPLCLGGTSRGLARTSPPATRRPLRTARTDQTMRHLADRFGIESPSCHGIRQTLEGSFSAVWKPNFASKYTFESSRILSSIIRVSLRQTRLALIVSSKNTEFVSFLAFVPVT